MINEFGLVAEKLGLIQEITKESELGDEESNLDSRSQSPASYH